MTDIINPDKTVMTHNADVYWHYAGDPVQRSQLLGTFTIGAPQKVLLPIPTDADIVLRAVPRGGRGQTFMAGPGDATPVTISALGVGSGGGTSNFYQQLRVNHGYSSGYAPTPRPILNLLNAFQVKDDAVFGESDLSTFGVPTGLLNLRTDCNASGQIAVTTATVSGTDIVLATTLELQPGQGIFVKGAGVSGADLVTKCLAVSADGKTITLAAGPFMPGPFTIVQADDTVAVQTWINGGSTSGAGAGGDLVMPPGYYRLTSPITLPTTSEGFSVIIHGAGWDLSVFAFQNTGDGFVSTSDLKIDSMVFTDLTIGTGTIGDASGTINPGNRGIGIRMTAPSYTGIYNNFVMQRCRVLGWGRWGLWSDNLEVSWISQCIFRENKSGHVAFVGPDTISPNKQPNANTITDTTFDQAISAGPSDVKRDFTGSMTAGSRTLTGSGFTSADRGKFVIVLGAATGSPGGDLYTFIDSVTDSTHVVLAHQAQQNSSGTVHLFPVNVASVLLNRANDTVIDGSTIQGNFADAGSGATNVLSDVNAIKMYNSANCRFIGIHEEDNAGPGGAAIRMENCYSITIENWGGTSAGPPLFDNAHGADFQLLNSHCVRVSQCFFNDRPQFLMDGNTSEVEIDNSLIVGYINLWQQDASYDRLRIGSGVRVYQAADPRTNQVAGNEYSYDGFFGRNLIVNGRFLDGTGGMEGWTTAAPTWWSLTTTSKTRGGTFLNVDATAIASSTMPTTILHQSVPIPDTTGPGLFTLAFDWNLDSQNGVETTGYYVEVRLHPSSGIDEVSQFSTRRFTVVQDTWQVGHVRCFLGAGTGRTIDIQVNVTPGPNNVIMHFANFRLAAGKHIYGAWEEGIHDFGGRMHAPIEFAHIATSGTGATAPPPVGATYASMVNDAGTMKLGYNGVWTNIGTGGSGTGVAAGTPNRFTIYNSSGSNIQNGPMQVTFGHVNIMSTGLWMDRTMPIFSVYPSGNAAKFVMIDTDDVVYLGPDSDTSGGVTGSNVTIRAGRGNSGTSVTSYKSTLQMTGATGLFTLNNQRSANTTDTLRVTLPDLSMDGVVVQQPPGTTGMLYLGHPFAFRDLAGSATFFSIDHNGGIDYINSRQYTWPSTTPVVTGGVPMVLGYTTQSVANNPVTLSWMAMTGGSGGAGHVIQDEGGPLPAQGALNFTGAGVTASNNTTFPRTDVTIWTATPTQEGTVSISAQHFGGRKHFDNGLAAYDSVSVPIVAQYTGSTTGAHIQEWWTAGGTPMAFIDTQPLLRLGIPGGADGFLEMCSAGVGSQTVQLGCGIGATAAQRIYFPKTFPSVGQVMQVQTAGGTNVQLQWGTGGTGSGYSQIQEDGTNLALRSILNFAGTGFTAADDGSRTTLTLFPASATQDGIVNNLTQTFTGRKTFNVGATMQGVASIEPVLTCKLIAGGGTSARVQEWQNSSATVIAYLDATPKFSMACDVLPDVDYPTTPRSLGTSALRWAQIGCGQITWNSSNVRDIFGSGSPTGISAPAGCVYRNTLGTAGQTLWVRESAAWVAVGAGGGGGAGTGTNNTLARWTTTSGILADAGIVDNVASGPGSAGSGIILNRDFIYGRADGTVNFGDTVTRIGGVYIKNALWMWSGANAGNSPSAPTTMGFLSGGASTYSRILVSGNENYIQGSPQGGRLTIGGYHAIELRGSRRNSSAGSISTTAGDGYGVLVWQEGSVNTIVPLIVGSQLALVGDLTNWQNNGVEQAALNAAGTLRMGGLQGRIIRLNPGAGVTVDMATQYGIFDCRTIVCDLTSGSFKIRLPFLSTCNGRSWHICLRPKSVISSAFYVSLMVQSGDDINEVGMSTASEWQININNINQRYVVITADYNAGSGPMWRLAGFYSP